jgi:rhamnosyltransferase subunit B
MEIVLTALGSAGDVHPFVGLGARLQRRGHRVTVFSNPLFESLIRSSGLDFEPIGTAAQFDAVQRDPNLWHPLRGFGTVVRFGIVAAMRPVFAAIAARSASGNLVVGAHSLDFGARIAQEKLGVPVATIHLAPVVFRSAELPPVLLPGLASVRLPRWATRLSYRLADAAICDRLLAPPVNAFRRELGLPPVRRLIDQWWYSPDRVLGLFPEWYAPAQSDWPPQTVLTGFPLWDAGELAELRPEVRQWLDQGDRPVVFTPGSAMLYGHAFFKAAADACQRLGRRGLLLTRFAEQLPERLPGGVRHFDYVPFTQLLPHAAALVHHGGIGSSSQALAAGVPQLVMPMAHDQHDNAARLARLGVAQWLRPRAFRGPAVTRALKRLLSSDQVALRCREAARRLAADGDPLERACDVIERLP